ncbi:MAG: tRNA lysidine(34) synthetase TilS [Alphaproteobacteria bacterium]
MKLNKVNFISNLNNNFIFEKNPNVAVAVSGGPDSAALIFLINEWINLVKGKVTSLIINHNLREESSKESKIVSNFLKEKKINTKILKVKKNKIFKKSMKEARINRYNLLTNYCRENSILYLFVAHHKDDQIETFVNRKISGSDFYGLQGIKNIKLTNQICIIRPLLNYSKKQIIKFNINNGIKFIEDPSNKNYDYTRSVIRKFLVETSLSIKKKINRDLQLIQDNSELYNQMISEQLIKNIIEAKKNYIKTNLNNLLDLDEIILERIIKKIYFYFYNQNIFLKSKKIKILISKLNDRNFKIFNLKSMIVKKDNNFLIFSKKTN